MNLVDYIRYIIMQTCYIPSIACSIFTLIHLLMNRNLRSLIHNHIPLVLLIISILDSLLNHPFTLNYLRVGLVMPSTNTICLLWNFINNMFTISIYWAMAWCSLERHLLIFYSVLFTTRRGRILFHYIPLVLTAFIYPLVFNIVVVLLYPCHNQFNMLSLFCGYTCALKVPSIALYARIVHNFLPIFIVAVFTIGLIIRVIKQKRQARQNRFSWTRYRRMIIQLLALVALFLILTLPAATVSIIQNCCLPTFASAVQTTYLNFLVRFITIFVPFICLSLLPEIWPKLLPCKKIRVHAIVTIPLGTNRT